MNDRYDDEGSLFRDPTDPGREHRDDAEADRAAGDAGDTGDNGESGDNGLLDSALDADFDRFADRVRHVEDAPGPPPALAFDDESGPMPHWSEPATGEIPRPSDPTGVNPVVDPTPAASRSEDELWASFTAEQPVWNDDSPEGVLVDSGRVTGETVATEPSRIVIGTDPAGIERRSADPSGATRRPLRRPGRRAPEPVPGTAPSVTGRDLPVATAVGLFLVLLFVGAMMWRPWSVAALVAVVLGLGAVEFYDKVTERGYRPAVVPGIVTCVTAPLAAYWLGDGTLPLVLLLGFAATAGTYIGSRSIDIGPLPNISITTLPTVWIGLAGAYAGLILRFSTTGEVLRADTGTDTLFMLALAVVANDVGALFVGSAAGRTPLRSWISPSKTVEGFIGGGLMTVVALVVVGIGGWNSTWDSTGHLLALAVIVSITAPAGDLIESMFKRNLGMKDFGSLVKGHGGVLDRFDGFLLTLPAVYYLTLILEPWAS